MILEVFLIEKLTELLDVPVYAERPTDPPGRFVVIDKTGSDRRNYLKRSTVAFQSYAESKYQALLLNESVKAAVDSLISHDEISRIDLNSDYSFPDLSFKHHRYQALYDFNHY